MVTFENFHIFKMNYIINVTRNVRPVTCRKSSGENGPQSNVDQKFNCVDDSVRN